MTLAPGTRLGSYEVLSPLGAGGMGEVYRATDTRLKRQVAIKILPDAVAADPERLVRFEREAELLASLNHPNIAAIYGVVDSSSLDSGRAAAHALVMELVEGPTLEEKIGSGPKSHRSGLPLDEALPIAKQIADALAAAHERGIVHRDLKPANIKVKSDGSVKVLDFGLAKALDRPTDPGGAEAPHHNASASPTLTSPALVTRAGIILGTAAYMSPEQARAQPADKRADIWAFGAILYEMLTGRRAFAGDTMSDTLAAVLEREPDWSALPASIPPVITRVLRQCLRKDSRLRRRDIADIAIELQESLQSSGQVAANTTPNVVGRSGIGVTLMYGMTALVLGGIIAASVMYRSRATTAANALERIELSILPPAGTTFPIELGAPWPSISPDGRQVAFIAVSADATQHLWTRALDSASPHLVEHTEGAVRPFWSPDSRAIGFFADGKIKRLDLPNGAPQVVCDAPYLGGMAASWGSQGTIIFTEVGGVFRVPASGGRPEMLLPNAEKEDGIHLAQNPTFLADGRTFVFLEEWPKREDDEVCVGSLDKTPPRCAAKMTSPVRYADPGYLLYVRDGVLRLQPFSPDRPALSGESTPVSSSYINAEPVYRPPSFSISPRALAYHPGTAKSRLVWSDRTGRVVSVVGEGSDSGAAISPDGTRIMVSRTDPQHPGNVDLWLRDSSMQTWSRFTFDPAPETGPVFSPDGTRVVYVSRRGNASQLFVKPVNGLAPERQLSHFPAAVEIGLSDWSADGRWVVYQMFSSATSWDIGIFPADGNGEPQLLLHSPHGERDGHLSSDMKWIAYDSTESGRREIWIQPVPPNSSRWQVSTGGGFSPRWRADGRELFYIAGDGKMMVVPITPGPTPIVGAPTPLFQTRRLQGGGGFRVSPDGQRFLITVPPDLSETDPITVIVNWRGDSR